MGWRQKKSADASKSRASHQTNGMSIDETQSPKSEPRNEARQGTQALAQSCARRTFADGLAARLNELESAASGWVAEDPTGTIPRLHRPDQSPSSIPLDVFLLELEAALTTAPVAWDPYDWQKTGA